MPNKLRSFIIYSRYYFALRPGTGWMQFQRKTLTVVGLAAPFGLPLEKVVAIVDRQEGLGMKLTKVHCPTHTDYNLTMFGSNQNTNSGPCESGHKEHIKKCQANATLKG